MRIGFLILIFSLFVNAVSFSKSKKILLKKIYLDNQITFYCSNPYKIVTVKGKQKALVVNDRNYYTPRRQFYKSGKVNIRAKRVEWEHVMPAHNFGKQLSCWKVGGRKACRKDKTFKTMEADMHNLVPAIGEVNGNRSNFRYGANKPNIGQYGQCNVQVDFRAKRAYVKDDIKGDIARIYFYMSDKYNVRLSKQERIMMQSWNNVDPVSQWEITKNKRVKKWQGNENLYIKKLMR